MMGYKMITIVIKIRIDSMKKIVIIIIVIADLLIIMYSVFVYIINYNIIGIKNVFKF